ncbi:MAG TPA: hypothetical protein VNM47_14635 [Terriglobia bacterium]|nr:hypothetical protein [Terriglobia bacterium]
MLAQQLPNFHLPEALPNPTVPKMMISALRVAGMPIILEQTELKDVKERLGGTIRRSGDASTADAWLCYFGGKANRRWELWISSGEIGGLRWIDGFTLQRLAGKAKPEKGCQMIPESGGGVKLPIALRLGQSEALVRKVLGKPTARYQTTLLYYHEHEESIHTQPYSVLNTVTVDFQEGAVFAIGVFKSSQS